MVSAYRISLFLQKENIGDLLIDNAQLSQAGVYTCTAQTVVDSAAASAKLVVRGETSQHHCWREGGSLYIFGFHSLFTPIMAVVRAVKVLTFCYFVKVRRLFKRKYLVNVKVRV